jgi:hypothetical protein
MVIHDAMPYSFLVTSISEEPTPSILYGSEFLPCKYFLYMGSRSWQDTQIKQNETVW